MGGLSFYSAFESSRRGILPTEYRPYFLVSVFHLFNDVHVSLSEFEPLSNSAGPVAVRPRHKPVVKILDNFLLVEFLVVEARAQVAEHASAAHGGWLVIVPPREVLLILLERGNRGNVALLFSINSAF